MQRPFRELNTLGVINITPNSFSDTAHHHFDIEEIKKTLENYRSNQKMAFDFGFESTAPMNQAITESEERSRFDDFFLAIKDINLNDCWISFDTYRPASFQYFEDQFISRYQNIGLIFNDVSGVLDLELKSFLKDKADQENFYYIYNNTHIPSRDVVLKHMTFIKSKDIIIDTNENFLMAQNFFKAIGFKNFILDLGFGFSKSYEQNWELINRFTEVTKTHAPLLIGLSKKSFLRKSLVDSKDPFSDSELLHKRLIKEINSKAEDQLLFRVHDLDLMDKIYAGL